MHIPLDGWLGRRLRAAHEGGVLVEGGAHGGVHGPLDKGGRELDDAQLGAREARDRVAGVEGGALVHARVALLHARDVEDVVVGADAARRVQDLGAVDVPVVGEESSWILLFVFWLMLEGAEK